MKKFTLGVLTLFTPLLALAWGQKGHDTTAAIAEAHLTDNARAAVDDLLDGKSLVYWSNWLDNASHTPQYEYSKTWHYKNINADEEFDKAYKNPKGDIITALNEQIAILGDTSRPKEERALALKIVTHLMGDMHQPMHMGHYTDLGGNKVTVKFFGRFTNLHSIWDSNVLESGHKWSYSEWRDQIDRLSPEEIAEVQSGTVTDWAKETYEICKDVYEATPEGTEVSFDYIATWTPTIEKQLEKAGLRLASVLNNALK